MPDDDLEIWVLLEQTRSAEPQRMDRRIRRKAPGRAHQPRMSLVFRRLAEEWRARMDVERHIQLGNLLPERPVFRQIVIERGIGLVLLGEAVHQRADIA